MDPNSTTTATTNIGGGTSGQAPVHPGTAGQANDGGGTTRSLGTIDDQQTTLVQKQIDELKAASNRETDQARRLALEAMVTALTWSLDPNAATPLQAFQQQYAGQTVAA